MIFCISTSEDKLAHRILLELYEKYRATCLRAVPITDGILDHACLTSAAEYFGERQVFLHRDLQRVKTDITKESRAKDPVTGQARLRKPELLPVFKKWVMASAFWPSDMERDSFWSEALSRMKAEVLETDFKEPGMEAYFRRHIFDESHGHLRAQWGSGLDEIVPGYTTYSANAAERWHRTVKDLMGDNYKSQGLRGLMVEVCTIMNSRIRRSYYKTYVPSITAAPQALRKAQRLPTVAGHSSGDDGEGDGRLLDEHTTAEHRKKHKAAGTYLFHRCQRTFPGGLRATLVYIMPQLKLKRASQNPEEMQRMLMLATANTPEEIRAACASPQNTYDLLLHIKLRQIYTAIWWCDGGIARGESKDYVKNGGHSGHALFIRGLHRTDQAAPIPREPSSKRKRHA